MFRTLRLLTGSIAILSLLLLAAAPASALTYDSYLSYPGNIPLFDHYSTPVLKPGSEGALKFNITNRYVNPMKNCTLRIGIYQWATIEATRDIKEVHSPPEFKDCSVPNWEQNGSDLVLHLGTLRPGVNMTIQITISTEDSTPEGTYFVRSMLVFDYTNITGIVMLSRGYFSKQLWDRATIKDDNESTTFGLNLTLLNCTGIIPDTSFSIKKPLSPWVPAILIALIVIFGSLALLFYLMDELGYFKGLKQIIDGKGQSGDGKIEDRWSDRRPPGGR